MFGPIFCNINKKNIGSPELSLPSPPTPPPPTSDNISFLPYVPPHPPQKECHMCITPYEIHGKAFPVAEGNFNEM